MTDVVDLGRGCAGLLPTEGVVLALGELGRVVVRPSGTEPKLKAYVEVDAAEGRDVAREQRARAADTRRGACSPNCEVLLRL